MCDLPNPTNGTCWIPGKKPSLKLKTFSLFGLKKPEVCITPYVHKFHKDCLQKWLEIKKNCPTCRHSLRKEQFVLLPSNWADHETNLQDEERKELLPNLKKSFIEAVGKFHQSRKNWKSWVTEKMNNLFNLSSSEVHHNARAQPGNSQSLRSSISISSNTNNSLVVFNHGNMVVNSCAFALSRRNDGRFLDPAKSNRIWGHQRMIMN